MKLESWEIIQRYMPLYGSVKYNELNRYFLFVDGGRMIRCHINDAGVIFAITYFENNQKHRKDGPQFRYLYENKNQILEEYWEHDRKIKECYVEGDRL
jgi:hypothetical protein